METPEQRQARREWRERILEGLAALLRVVQQVERERREREHEKLMKVAKGGG